MADLIKENWKAKPMAASGELAPLNGKLGGFFCCTDGTVEITEGVTSGGSDIVAEFPVVGGTWYRLPFDLLNGAYVTLGGGATGTFAV